MLDPAPDRVTLILEEISAGDAGAEERLLAAVYDDLRSTARRLMSREPEGHVLQATALIHESYLRLRNHLGRFENRRHLLHALRRAMWRVLVDYVRKYPRNLYFTTVSRLADEPDTFDAADVVRVLEDLGRISPRARTVVDCRFLLGLTIEETAEHLGVSHGTVETDWRMARAWLYERLTPPR